MSKENKATKVEYERRLNEIITLLIDGYSRKRILHYVSDNEWDISERMVEEYMHEATEYIKTFSKLDRDSDIGRAYLQYFDLYQMAKNKKDHNGARQILKDFLETFGYKVNRTELTGKDGTPLIKQVIKFGDKEIEF